MTTGSAWFAARTRRKCSKRRARAKPTKATSARSWPAACSGSTCTASARSSPTWGLSGSEHDPALSSGDGDARRHVERRLFPRIRLAPRPRRARRIPPAGNGQPRPAPDRRDGRRRSAASKVAVVRKSEREGIDVDYLFLQVFVDQAIVTDQQNCGNILAGVGPFAIERGLVSATGDETRVVIFMVTTGP